MENLAIGGILILVGILTIVKREIGIGEPKPAFYISGRVSVWIGIFLILLGLASVIWL